MLGLDHAVGHERLVDHHDAAGISFLGFGVQPPTPEWGLMVSEGAAYIVSGDWWVSFFPGIAAFSLTAGLTLLDDGLCSRL